MSGDLGTPGVNSDSAYHVLIIVGDDIDECLKVDGFAVKVGNANGSWNDFISVNGFNFVVDARCGRDNVHGSPHLNGMKITNNSSGYIGGDVLNEGGNPTVRNTVISENSAEYGEGWSLINGEGRLAIIYPSPAIESIMLTVPPTLIQSAAILYDVTGRALRSIAITANVQRVSIKSLRSGVYILRSRKHRILK